MTISLFDDSIYFTNKVSKSTHIMNEKSYEKYMAYFPNILFNYLNKPQHIYLKKDGDEIRITRNNGVGCIERRVYEVSTKKTKYHVFILPKQWVDNPPMSITYKFWFDSKEITITLSYCCCV